MEQTHNAEVAQLARTIRQTQHEKGEALRRAVDLEFEHQSAAELLASATWDAEVSRRREEHEIQLRTEQEQQRVAQKQALETQCHALEQRIRSDEQEKLRWIALEQHREEQAAQRKAHEHLTGQEHRVMTSGVSSGDGIGVGTGAMVGEEEEEEEEERKLWRLQRKIFLEREGDVGRLNPTQMFNFGGGKVVEKGRPEPRVIRRWEQSDVIPVNAGGVGNWTESESDTHITTTGERPAHIVEEIRRAAEAVRSGFLHLALAQGACLHSLSICHFLAFRHGCAGQATGAGGRRSRAQAADNEHWSSRDPVRQAGRCFLLPLPERVSDQRPWPRLVVRGASQGNCCLTHAFGRCRVANCCTTSDLRTCRSLRENQRHRSLQRRCKRVSSARLGKKSCCTAWQN